MKFKRAGMLTKLLLLILLIASVSAFLNLQSQVSQTEDEAAQWQRQVERQKQENQDLADAIADKDDPQRIEDVARKRLGLVLPGEIVFRDSGT